LIIIGKDVGMGGIENSRGIRGIVLAGRGGELTGGIV